VIVVPLTSDTDGQERLPMPVLAAAPAIGLRHTSAAMCGRVSCVRKDRLSAPMGQLSSTDLRRIRLGVAAVIGLSDRLV
jgi:mRNA interferase MazF